MKRLALLLSMLTGAYAVPAQELTLPMLDAKMLGMGGVAMTTLSGSHAIYNNAAIVAFSPSPAQFSGSFYKSNDINYYGITASGRFDNANVLQIGWKQLFFDADNNDSALDLGYSRRIGDRWAVGVVGRYMRTKRSLDGGKATASALAADLSVAYQLPLENIGAYSTLRAGAKLGNLGGYLDKTGCRLPMDFKAGVALDTYLTDAHEITVGADLGYFFTPSPVRGFQASIGAEYNLMQLIQLRGGYHYGQRKEFYPSYGSLGFGVRFMHIRLDFAYLFAKKDTPLHNTYSISFGFDF